MRTKIRFIRFQRKAAGLVALLLLPLAARADDTFVIFGLTNQAINGATLSLSENGFRIVLTTDLSDVVESRLGAAITQFLAAQGLTADDVGAWICHPGGPRVIDAVQRALKLADEAVSQSREALAEAGNMSSASVLHILERVGDAGVAPGTFGLMIGLGPGVSAELVLLRW